MTPYPQQDHEKVWKLTARGDAGMTIERDTDLAYLRNQKRRYENMGMDCRIEESLCHPDTHTPAAPATGYTIEQIANIDNRIRKARKAEREQVMELYESVIWIDLQSCGVSREVANGIFLNARKKLESRRGGAP